MSTDIRIGVSACVLGESVRFDGGHKRDPFVAETLAPLVQFVPMCPEVDIGLGTPRESLRLVRSGNGLRMVAPRSGLDHTERMQEYGREKARQIGRFDLSGFILKKDSPSCGMTRVRVYDRSGVPARTGRGLFARALMDAYPNLPVEEDGRLRDPRLRENFFERVFAYRRMKSFFDTHWTIGRLVDFHAREKSLLLAHDAVTCRELGRLVAGASRGSRVEVAEEYAASFMSALRSIATTKRHRNVLEHITGHFKKLLSREERRNLRGLIDDFAKGFVPLVVPVTLIRHFVRLHNVGCLLGQTYLNPHPKELMLRNHV